MRRFGLLLPVIALLLWSLPLASVSAAAALPQISGQSAALVDLQTGKILSGYNQTARIFPASTTKILTALIVLEHSQLDEQVAISRLAQDQEGTSLYTREGEVYKLKDLLYAMLVQSCNDAAVALAEHVAGSVTGFAALMNEKATELGAVNSHFVNPNGLHQADHYSTAADMAVIFAKAMQNATIREITGTRIYRVTIGSGEERILVNGNDLLVGYEGTIGGKTGYTRQAEQCILSAASRHGMEIGVAVYKAQGKSVWTDASSWLDYGFKYWKSVSLVAAGQSVTAVPVRYGQNALLVADQPAALTMADNGSSEPLTRKVQLDQPLQAPLAAGVIVGVVSYFQGEQQVASVPLRVAAAVPRTWYTYWEVPLTTLVVGGLGYGLRHRVRPSPHMLDRRSVRTKRG